MPLVVSTTRAPVAKMRWIFSYGMPTGRVGVSGCEGSATQREYFQVGRGRTLVIRKKGVGVPGCEGPSIHATHFQAGQGRTLVMSISRCRISSTCFVSVTTTCEVGTRGEG